MVAGISKHSLYAVVAKRQFSGRARFVTSMGFHPSPEAAIDAVRKRLIIEPEFRKKYRGWTFAAMVADYILQVDQGGAVLLFQNEKEKLL